MGAGILTAIGNPVAWAVLGFTTLRIGKTAYDKRKAKLQKKGEEYDLFI